jgi:selenocysteine lyase/cysteine desulfurase
MTDSFVYLDHAATSWPKPPEVAAAVARWYAEVGVSEGRGDGSRCRIARDEVAFVRRRLGEACGVPAARVAFVSGATEGLNLTLRALLRPGARVLTTAFEHSSVVRPLKALEGPLGLALTVLGPDADGGIPAAAVVDAVQRVRPDLLVFTHASNVTGAVVDAAAWCAAARAVGCASVVDASQTAGWLPLDVGADVVVASAHKALLGPPGLGFVAAGPGVELLPQKQGGTGNSIALERHPVGWPTAFEAGTPNTPAVFGLAAALRWADHHPADARLAAALAAVDALVAGLAELAEVHIHRPPPGPRVPVLSFSHRRCDPVELGLILDAAGCHVRTGHHCAPWIHRHLGTEATGTIRVSPGDGLTAAQHRTVLDCVASV